MTVDVLALGQPDNNQPSKERCEQPSQDADASNSAELTSEEVVAVRADLLLLEVLARAQHLRKRR
jgi:hypothetical protein